MVNLVPPLAGAQGRTTDPANIGRAVFYVEDEVIESELRMEIDDHEQMVNPLGAPRKDR